MSLAQSWTSASVQRTAAPLRVQVTDAVRQAILEARLKPGQRLVERELVEGLGVSRTTVREALRELEAEGLIITIPQKGAVVRTLSRSEAEDLYDVRAGLESLIVKRFVHRASPQDVQRLREAFDHFAEVSASQAEVVEVLIAKDKFYYSLIAGARSDVLKQLLEGIQSQVQVLRAQSLSQSGRRAGAVAELRAVVESIEANDAERASALCADHVRSAAQTIFASFE
ncbi:GntR family transcriptional regulator [Plantactinospora sp. B6F1]|uniref:GntR family transcriptional regulator n=1 Tax=Plantactinospora sp. B6F1 TaxID=3158971 RepID=UPI0032D9885C